MDEKIKKFFRLNKNPDIQLFLNRLKGNTTTRVPYLECVIDSKIASVVLEKSVPTTLDINFPMEDRIELARRTGLSAVGFGVYWKPGIGTKEKFNEVRRQGPPDQTVHFEQLKRLCEATKKTNIGCFCYTHGPLDPLYLCADLEKFWLLTMDDPNFLYEVGDYILEEYKIPTVKKIIDCGVDFLHIGDDLAFKSGLMVKPDFFFEYYPERLSRLIAPAKKAGVPVTFHSDGKVDMVVDMLIEKGISGLNPIEPYSNDINEFARRWGDKISLIGNVELALTSPQKVASTVSEHIRNLGQRYIPSSSHSVTNDVKPEIYAAFLQAIHGIKPNYYGK